MSRPRRLARTLPLLAGLASGPAVPGTALAQDTHPPAAERRPVTLEAHGDVRTDPYFWLRARESPEVIAHLEAENAWFDAQMAPLAGLQDELFDEIRERIPQDDATVPFRLGEHYYYRRYEDGEQYPIHARRAGSLEALEQVLLDVNELAEGHEYYSAIAGSASISPDGRLLAWAADTTGRRFYTIRVLDMATGEMLPDEIADVSIGPGGDGRCFRQGPDGLTTRFTRNADARHLRTFLSDYSGTAPGGLLLYDGDERVLARRCRTSRPRLATARPIDRTISAVSGTLTGMLVWQRRPAAAMASASSTRFSSSFSSTRSVASSTIRSIFGFLVPPTFSIRSTRPSGCTQNFVRPTRSSSRPRSR